MPNAVLERCPRLRRITDASVIQRVLATVRRNSLVAERLRFVVGELRGGTRTYRLAADPNYRVVLRHGSHDAWVLDEIHRPPGAYEPPPAVAEVLQEIAARRPLRVLDLGANVGLFAVYVLSRYPGAVVTSYEPEPDNARVLTRCAEHNAFANLRVVSACAMATAGTVMITPGAFSHAGVCDTNGVEVPGVDVLPLFADYDFVKMDIEGSEWPILRDERWPSVMPDVKAFVLEWHKRGCPERQPGEAAVAAVKEAGFTVSASDLESTHGVIWAWRS